MPASYCHCEELLGEWHLDSIEGSLASQLYDQSMPNKPFAFALFLSSYSPAFLILAVRAIDRSYALFVVSLTLAVGSSGLFLLFIRFARAGVPYKAEILEVEPHDADLAAYVATYLLPFIVVFPGRGTRPTLKDLSNPQLSGAPGDSPP